MRDGRPTPPHTQMLVHVMAAISTNLRILKAQLLALRRFNIDATTTPVYVKYRSERPLPCWLSI